MFSKSELIIIIMYGGISYVNSVRYDQKALGRESGNISSQFVGVWTVITSMH